MATSLVKSAAKQRPPNAGKGRRAGVPNKLTGAFRETVTKLLEDNAENASRWLADVAKDDPAKALDLLVKLAEYAVPKLARIEAQTEIHSQAPELHVHFGKERLDNQQPELSGEELRLALDRRGLNTNLFDL